MSLACNADFHGQWELKSKCSCPDYLAYVETLFTAETRMNKNTEILHKFLMFSGICYNCFQEFSLTAEIGSKGVQIRYGAYELVLAHNSEEFFMTLDEILEICNSVKHWKYNLLTLNCYQFVQKMVQIFRSKCQTFNEVFTAVKEKMK
uniref:PPPDE domain-containing protein n=1 Tax=Panagrolaimus sp. ES5 TaxID=591445 RepID=A0AC34GNC4_9BILA